MKITRSPIGSNRFRIYLPGDRRLFEAENIHEAQQALAHYYGFNHERDACPLCHTRVRTTKAHEHTAALTINKATTQGTTYG